jgi:hypothetical protein
VLAPGKSSVFLQAVLVLSSAMKLLAILVIALLLTAPSIRAQNFSNPVGFRLAQSEALPVWVKTAMGVYHYPGNRKYEKTKQGKFMSEIDANAQGHQAAGNRE